MFKNLRVRRDPPKPPPTPTELTLAALQSGADLPIGIRAINNLHPAIKARVYRGLLPHSLLGSFHIDPITWQGVGRDLLVALRAGPDSNTVEITVSAPDTADPILVLELADGLMSGIELNLLVLSDPNSPRFNTDVDANGKATQFGTTGRNLAEEERAMANGLAPGQVRTGLKGSQLVLQQVESFLVMLGHRAFYLEPLTYASAWVFERRGFAYTKGHKLMETIHQEFQPDGKLYAALDGSTPFRQPHQWDTVRGRAWAIQDGILDVIGAEWNGLRMVRQLGRDSQVQTFPDARY